jgi:hypothetical protein
MNTEDTLLKALAGELDEGQVRTFGRISILPTRI